MVVVWGVSGVGKSVVGAALANALGVPFLDADAYHPPANIAKMSQGQPLNDDDRWPWLDAVGQAFLEQGKSAGGAVVACSALRRDYRCRLIAASKSAVSFVFLQGPKELVAQRLAQRSDHFMPTALLDSQLATLEPPQNDEHVLTLDIHWSVPELVQQVVDHLETSALKHERN